MIHLQRLVLCCFAVALSSWLPLRNTNAFQPQPIAVRIGSRLSYTRTPRVVPEDWILDKQRRKRNKLIPVPPKEVTGVEPIVMSICATVSQQIYAANSTRGFSLPELAPPVEVVDVINHGILEDSVPRFAIVVRGELMILVWRGTVSLLDATSDVAYGPVSLGAWIKESSQIKAPAGFSALVESDLSLYREKIVGIMKEKKIKELVLTGHSLGGAMAQVAHLYLTATAKDPNSTWHEALSERDVSCSCVSFAAPMTTLVALGEPPEPTPKLLDLLAELSQTSCCLVYGEDIVPHAAGDINYCLKVLRAISLEFVKDKTWLPKSLTAYLLPVDQWVADAINNAPTVLSQYFHVGKIVYYRKNGGDPIVFREFARDMTQAGPSFREYTKEHLTPSLSTRTTAEYYLDHHRYFPRKLCLLSCRD